MRDGVVEAAYAAVLADAEVLEELDDGVGVVLAPGVGLADVQEDVVPVAGRVEGVVDYGVGYGEGAHTVDGAHDGPVAGEVEEFAGTGEPAELFGAEVALDLAEHEAADLADVYPWGEHGQRAGLAELGQVVGYFEGGYSHGGIVPE